MNPTLDQLKALPTKNQKQFEAYRNWLSWKYLSRQRKERALAQNRLEAGVPESEVEHDKKRIY